MIPRPPYCARCWFGRGPAKRSCRRPLSRLVPLQDLTLAVVRSVRAVVRKGCPGFSQRDSFSYLSRECWWGSPFLFFFCFKYLIPEGCIFGPQWWPRHIDGAAATADDWDDGTAVAAAAYFRHRGHRFQCTASSQRSIFRRQKDKKLVPLLSAAALRLCRCCAHSEKRKPPPDSHLLTKQSIPISNAPFACPAPLFWFSRNNRRRRRLGSISAGPISLALARRAPWPRRRSGVHSVCGDRARGACELRPRRGQAGRHPRRGRQQQGKAGIGTRYDGLESTLVSAEGDEARKSKVQQ